MSDGFEVAIKKIEAEAMFESRKHAKMMLREIVILRKLGMHGAIAQLVDILPPKDFNNIDTLYLVFEYVDSDLEKLITSEQPLTLSAFCFLLLSLFFCLGFV